MGAGLLHNINFKIMSNDLNQMLLRVISENPDAIYIIDLEEHKTIFFNRDEFLGYPKEKCEATGSLLEFLHPDDIGIVSENWENIKTFSNETNIEFRLRAKDGIYHYISLRSKTLSSDRDGRPLVVLIILSDCTERKMFDEELRKSENKHKDLVEHAPIGIAIYQEGRFVYINKTACDILRIESPDDMLGKPVLSIVHPDSVNSVIERMSKVAKGYSLDPFEEMLIRKDGEGFVAEVSAIPVTFNNKAAAQVLATDITARKKAEEKLAASENLYRSIFNNSLIGVSQTTANGQFLRVNEAFARMYGFSSPDELIREIKDVRQFYSNPGERIEILRILDTRETLGPMEFVVKKRDGTAFHVLCTIRKIIDETGKFICYQAEQVDITENKKTLEALRESLEKYRVLSEQGGLGIGLYSYDGKIIFFNDRALKNLGGKSEDFIGRDLIQVFGDAAGNEYLRRIRLAADTGKSTDYEDYYESPGGAFWFLSNHAPVYGFSGELIGVQVLAHDITEWKKAEIALIQSEKKYRELFDSMEEAFALHEIITDKNGKPVDYLYVDVNRSFCKITGLEASEVIGRKVTEVIPGIEKSWIRRYGKVALTGKSQIFESFAGPLGKYYHVVAFSPARGSFATLFYDISDRIKYEEELKRSSENLRLLNVHIEEAREKERNLISLNLHDDLGQKLTALKMDISWLRKRIGVQSEIVSNKFKEINRLIDESVNTIQKISSDLRPQILFDLGLFPALDWLLEELENNSGIRSVLNVSPLHFDIPEHLSVVIYRIVQEAITNVKRHAEASIVKVTLKRETSYIFLSIEDNGRGIPKEKLNKPGSFGLDGMKERAEVLNGRFKIFCGKRGGTKILVRIPFSTDT